MKPTEAQIKELLEWSGLDFREPSVIVRGRKSKRPGWYCRDNFVSLFTPPIDLNNLFKYAVPKLDELGEYYITLQKRWNKPEVKQATVNFVGYTQEEYDGEGETYALALFWAIYGAVK